MGLNDRQLKAINYLKEHNKITNGEYQSLTGCSRNTASRDLNELVKNDLILSSSQKGSGSFYYLR